jgi:hypothetical protein
MGLAWLDLAASQAHLGRREDARAALEEAGALPGGGGPAGLPTIAEYRKIFSYVDPDFLERWLDGLRKAGLSEE